MKRAMAAAMLVTVMGSTAGLSGCVQMPTEKQGIVDLRPQIAFSTDTSQTGTARVLLDGLDVGQIGDFLDGVAALRVLSGSHQVRVVLGSEILLDEKFYLGDGVNRAFLVK